MVINALINAAQNGKHVVAVLELQARFDEEANIGWAKHLQEQGVQVIYGVPGLKVHAKFCFITRLENGKLQHYANLTTGNYNEATSLIYCDDSLLTADSRITKEVEHVFEFFEKNFKVHTYKHLVLSPHSTRKKLVRLIENEIAFAQSGKRAEIFLKMNSLVDEELISKLYEASNAGVKIKIIVRGMCGVIPAIKGLSENIEIVSLVDRLLEHSRILFFRNGGEQLCYISSADWMGRNMDSRIEVSCPVYDEKLQKELHDILELQWQDNVKARIVDATQSNRHKNTGSAIKIRAQEAIYKYLQGKTSRALLLSFC
jgi:polyphosphate kinase